MVSKYDRACGEWSDNTYDGAVNHAHSGKVDKIENNYITDTNISRPTLKEFNQSSESDNGNQISAFEMGFESLDELLNAKLKGENKLGAENVDSMSAMKGTVSSSHETVLSHSSETVYGNTVLSTETQAVSDNPPFNKINNKDSLNENNTSFNYRKSSAFECGNGMTVLDFRSSTTANDNNNSSGSIQSVNSSSNKVTAATAAILTNKDYKEIKDDGLLPHHSDFFVKLMGNVPCSECSSDIGTFQ